MLDTFKNSKDFYFEPNITKNLQKHAKDSAKNDTKINNAISLCVTGDPYEENVLRKKALRKNFYMNDINFLKRFQENLTSQ